MAQQNTQINSLGAKLRDKSYTGLTLAEQTDAQKGSAVTARAKSYTGLTLAQQTDAQKGSAVSSRAKSYSAGDVLANTENKNRAYVTNQHFVLTIGDLTIKCARISNLSMHEEIEEVPEGGNNQYPNVFFAPIKKADTLVVERGILQGAASSDLLPGVHVGVGVIQIYYGKVSETASPNRSFYFEQGMITKCEYSNLDAMGNEIMIEKLEIAHTGLI